MLYSTKEAALYLGISVDALKYHIYQGNITPQKVGHSLVFTQDELEHFKVNRRPQGRPKQSKEKDNE